MNVFVDLYYFLVILAIFITGFLAWQSWIQRRVPGGKAYFGLAIAMAAASVGELAAMISPNETAALFWFNIRFFPFAIIAPLWLLFVLDYSGRRNWISTKFLFLLFIIPLITQIMVWSSQWQSYWVYHEVAFQKIGHFWVAQTSSRVPGPWFLVHIFYTQLLMIVGSVILFIAAVRLPKTMRVQSALLIASALLPILNSIITTFNLLPEGFLNPTIPGFAVSAGLVAAALFKFSFLKETPTSLLGVTLEADPSEKRSRILYFLVFIFFITGIATFSYMSYFQFEQDLHAQYESQLKSVIALKTNEITRWKTERLGDAEVLKENRAFFDLAKASLRDDSHSSAQGLQEWLDSIRKHYHYAGLYLIDPQGKLRFSSPSTAKRLDRHILSEIPKIVASREVSFLDFHVHDNGQILISMIVPIAEQDSDAAPLGAVILEVDPKNYVFPFFSQWPVSSESAETLLVRREGEEVLVLSPMRFNASAPMSFKIPLTDSENVISKAAQNPEKIVEGVSYRGDLAFGVLQPVSNSPWFIFAQINQREVYALLQGRIWQLMIVFCALVVASGAAIFTLWRQQRVRNIQLRLKTVESLRNSEEKFRLAFETSPVAITITRLSDGSLISVNRGFENFLGFSPDEVKGQSTLIFNIWDDLNDREEVIRLLLEKGTAENYEARFRAKDGSFRYGLVSSKLLDLNGEAHILTITRDITERKNNEEIILRHNKFLIALQQTTLELLSQLDLNQLFENIVLRAGDILDTDSGYLELLDSDSYRLRPRFAVGALSESLIHEVRPGEGVAGIVWQTGKGLIVNDYDHWPNRIESYSSGILYSVAAVPLFFNQKFLGVLGLGYDFESQKHFDDTAIDFLTQFAQLAALSIEHTRLYTEARQELEERKRVEEEVRKLNLELEQRVEARTRELSEAQEQLLRQEKLAFLGQLAGGLGHELRKPLAVINNALYVLRIILTKTDAKVTEYLQIIDDEVRTADKIIYDLLNFSRTKLEKPDVIAVSDLIAESVQRFSPPQSVDLKQNLSEQIHLVKVDRQQMIQVLGNLLVNAYQAMPQGGGLTIEEKVEEPGWVCIQVQDQGVGILPENLTKLFEPLFTTKPNGIGLGLAVSRKLIEAHGGRIKAQSIVGFGSTFAIHLPLFLKEEVYHES